jgi:site-specific recombinase XerD
LILRKFHKSLPGAKLVCVQKKDVVEYKDTLLATGASGKTINNHVSAISAFFKFAVKNGLCSENVAKGLNCAFRAIVNTHFAPM